MLGGFSYYITAPPKEDFITMDVNSELMFLLTISLLNIIQLKIVFDAGCRPPTESSHYISTDELKTTHSCDNSVANDLTV